MFMTDGYNREEADFLSDGERCAAWLYRPVDSIAPLHPIIVMAHGFAGVRTSRLPEYAARFARHGLAVLLFDYRHFGDSDGQPRNWVDHRRQHRDWLSAIDHVKNIAGIDSKRMGLWGTSFSGGHALTIAAEVKAVHAIVLQTPMLHILRSLRMPVRFMPLALWHAVRDYLSAILGHAPHYIPIVAPPQQFAALNQPGCDEGFRSLLSADTPWQNQVTARSLLSSASFRPSVKAAQVGCPALLIIADQDQVIRPRVIEKVAGKLPDAELVHVAGDHFQIYRGELFEQLSELQAEFFARHLR